MTTYLRGSADIHAVTHPTTTIITRMRKIANLPRPFDDAPSLVTPKRAGDLLGVVGDDDPEPGEPSLPPSSAHEPDRAKAPRGAAVALMRLVPTSL